MKKVKGRTTKQYYLNVKVKPTRKISKKSSWAAALFPPCKGAAGVVLTFGCIEASQALLRSTPPKHFRRQLA